MISNKVVAVDFGSTFISVMAAEVLESGAVKIFSEESKPSEEVKWGIVEKPTGASFKISELLKLLKNSSKISDISPVSVAIGAKSMKIIQKTVNRSLGKVYEITNDLLADMLEECERSVANQNITVFETIPVSYTVDGKLMDDPVGLNARQITATYNVVVGNSIIKAELERCFDRTGVVMEYNPLAIQALSTVVLEEQDREVGCALINLGATTTTMGVYHDGILRNYIVVPLGADNITKDIQELGISEANAEKLKCLKGFAMDSLVVDPVYIQVAAVEAEAKPVNISTKFLATIIEARLEEILKPVFDIISNLSFKLEAGIVLTGGGAKLNKIIEFITEKIGIYSRLGDHSDWLSDDTDKKYFDPKYSLLVGTILLTHDYRIEHPEVKILDDPDKQPKLPGNGSRLIKKLTQTYTNYFGSQSEIKFE
ncbi:MAG: cell division protein FtsA [Paludibacter sp.]